MRSFKILSLVALFAISAFALTAFINIKRNGKISSGNKGFAVVELFTSEGCSSCPPADELVAKVEKESTGTPVYILAYHVDYWNRLGWKDQFSSADYSKRQNEYADYLKLNSVYTPQIVVNGKTEFIGSQEGTLRNAIRTSLEQTPSTQLALNIATVAKGEASLKYSTEGTDKKSVLLIAVLQKNAQTKVERGENSGHTLSHVQIVRKLQQFNLNGSSGVVGVTLPEGFDLQKYEIIGFLQNKANGTVTAAARVDLTAAYAVENPKNSK